MCEVFQTSDLFQLANLTRKAVIAMAMTRNGDQYSASSPLPENSVAAIALSIVAIL